jgi:hypothetical protein
MTYETTNREGALRRSNSCFGIAVAEPMLTGVNTHFRPLSAWKRPQPPNCLANLATENPKMGIHALRHRGYGMEL